MNSGYQPPKIRTMLLSAMIATALVFTFLNLAEAIKWLGLPFFFLPQQLGFVKQVQQEEIQIISLSQKNREASLQITQPGKYVLYSRDVDFLLLSLIKMAKPTSKKAVPLFNVDRGIRPYDTVMVKGRPLLRFTIETPGEYVFTYPRLNYPATAAILPDYIVDNEETLNMAYLLQFMVIIIPPSLLSYGKYRQNQAKLKARQADKRAEMDEFWQRVTDSNKKRGGLD